MRCNPICYCVAALFFSVAAGRAEDEKEGISAEVEIPVSIGQVLKGMRLPHYDKDKPDKLSLRFNADTAERTSETQFTFKGLRIEVFEESPEKPALQVILNCSTPTLPWACASTPDIRMSRWLCTIQPTPGRG